MTRGDDDLWDGTFWRRCECDAWVEPPQGYAPGDRPAYRGSSRWYRRIRPRVSAERPSTASWRLRLTGHVSVSAQGHASPCHLW